MQVSQNTVVSIDYTLKNDQGTVIDTSQGHGPLDYIHGVGMLVPGLEKALQGKNPGDRIQVKVSPAEGYGERNEALVNAIPKNQFDPSQKLVVGMQFQAESSMGILLFRIIGLDEQSVTVDGNHPLAGVELHFDVTVRYVRTATPEELEHGHVHGPEGHHH